MFCRWQKHYFNYTIQEKQSAAKLLTSEEGGGFSVSSFSARHFVSLGICFSSVPSFSAQNLYVYPALLYHTLLQTHRWVFPLPIKQLEMWEGKNVVLLFNTVNCTLSFSIFNRESEMLLWNENNWSSIIRSCLQCTESVNSFWCLHLSISQGWVSNFLATSRNVECKV